MLVYVMRLKEGRIRRRQKREVGNLQVPGYSELVTKPDAHSGNLDILDSIDHSEELLNI